jgi:hypothetical protein
MIVYHRSKHDDEEIEEIDEIEEIEEFRETGKHLYLLMMGVVFANTIYINFFRFPWYSLIRGPFSGHFWSKALAWRYLFTFFAILLYATSSKDELMSIMLLGILYMNWMHDFLFRANVNIRTLRVILPIGGREEESLGEYADVGGPKKGRQTQQSERINMRRRHSMSDIQSRSRARSQTPTLRNIPSHNPYFYI